MPIRLRPGECWRAPRCPMARPRRMSQGSTCSSAMAGSRGMTMPGRSGPRSRATCSPSMKPSRRRFPRCSRGWTPSRRTTRSRTLIRPNDDSGRWKGSNGCCCGRVRCSPALPQKSILRPIYYRFPDLIISISTLILTFEAKPVQPLLLVFEDLHWIDAETHALLDTLVESLPTARLLLLVNYRSEYHHRWGSKTYYTQLRLDPLPPASADEILQALLGDDPSLAPLKQLLIARTEGNPFFLEESVQALGETGVLVGEPGAYRLAQ